MDSASGPTYSLCPTAFPLASVLSTRVTGLRRRSREVMRKLYLVTMPNLRIAEAPRRRGTQYERIARARGSASLFGARRPTVTGGSRSRRGSSWTRQHREVRVWTNFSRSKAGRATLAARSSSDPQNVPTGLSGTDSSVGRVGPGIGKWCGELVTSRYIEFGKTKN